MQAIEDGGMDLHPSFIEENGKRVFAVLPIREYETLTSHLDDLEDLLSLRNAKKETSHEDLIDLNDVKSMLDG